MEYWWMGEKEHPGIVVPLLERRTYVVVFPKTFHEGLSETDFTVGPS